METHIVLITGHAPSDSTLLETILRLEFQIWIKLMKSMINGLYLDRNGLSLEVSLTSVRTLPSKAWLGQSNPQWIGGDETGAAQSVAALLGHAKAMEQWMLESRTGWPPSPEED